MEHLTGRMMLVAASALVATLMSGCAGAQPSATNGSSTSAPNGNQATSAPSGNQPTQGGGNAPGLPATTAGAALPPGTSQCKAANLKAALGGGGGGAAGHVDTGVQFTNIGSTPCVMQGFPGVSFVSGDNGQQIGAPADRDGAPGASVTVAPGQTAHAPLRMLNGTGGYAPNDPQCQATSVGGLRVYPPGDTASLFIPDNTTTCGNPSNHTMTVQTVQAGDGVTH